MPRINKPLVIDGREAEDAITARRVVIEGTSDGQVKGTTTANAQVAGVATDEAAVGERVNVCTFGPTICVAAGSISKGDLVAISGTAGKVASITLGSTTNDQRLVGKALEAASSDGDEISVFVGLNDSVLV